MKRLLYLICFFSFFNCSNQEEAFIEERKCDCEVLLIQITVDNREVIQGRGDITTECSRNGQESDIVYNTQGTKIIQLRRIVCP